MRSTERRFKRPRVDKARRRGEGDGGQALDVCDCRELVDEVGVGRRLLVRCSSSPLNLDSKGWQLVLMMD